MHGLSPEGETKYVSEASFAKKGQLSALPLLSAVRRGQSLAYSKASECEAVRVGRLENAVERRRRGTGGCGSALLQPSPAQARTRGSLLADQLTFKSNAAASVRTELSPVASAIQQVICR